MGQEVLKGNMKVSLKQEKGLTLTQQYGFYVEEENKKHVLGFDLYAHPELGTTLLFGNQVFFLKFWKDEDLEKGQRLILDAISKEKQRRSIPVDAGEPGAKPGKVNT